MIEFIKKKELLLVFLIAILITALFFYKTVLHQQIPFPGDALVNENPYKTQSFLGYAPEGYPSLGQGRDVFTQLYPWKYFTVQELKAGRIPFWNPYNFSGNVHMQNYQTGVFYPFNLLFFLGSFPMAWAVFIMLQPFLAILFMYLFLRSLSLHKGSSLIGGIAFGFSSYMTVWLEYGNIGSALLWLPLLLFSLKKFLEKPRMLYFVIALSSFICSFLAGYIQGTFYIYIVAFLFVVYQIFSKKLWNKDSRTKMISLGLLFFLPICLTAFQLLPGYAIFHVSTRNNYSLKQIENLLQPLFYWVTMFAPDFFGNPAHRNYFLLITYMERVMYFSVPLLFFAFFGIAKVKDTTMRFFLFLGAFFLLVTTNFPLIKYLYLFPLPMISTTVPTRALSIFIFCMIIVACYGIDYWQKKKEKTLIPFCFLGMYGLIWVSVFLFPKIFPEVAANRSITLHNLVIPTIFAAITIVIFYANRIKKLQYITLLLLFLLVTADLFLFFQKITPFSPKALIYPQTPVISYLQKNAGINRFWGYGAGYIASNFQTYDGTYSPEGYDPLYLKSYALLVSSSSTGTYPQLLPRPDANIAPGDGVGGMKNVYRQTILNLLGVKYVMYEDAMLGDTLQPHQDIFPEETYRLVWQQKPWQIYENTKVLPRFFLTSDYILAANEKDALAKIYTTNLAKNVILTNRLTKPLNQKATGTVSLTNYSSQTITFTTNTTGNMLLFLSDNYFPEWKAKIDNKVIPIYQADLTFRAIEVPKGKHTVTFFYSPESFSQGIKIAVFGLVVLLIYILCFYKYVEKK